MATARGHQESVCNVVPVSPETEAALLDLFEQMQTEADQRWKISEPPTPPYKGPRKGPGTKPGRVTGVVTAPHGPYHDAADRAARMEARRLKKNTRAKERYQKKLARLGLEYLGKGNRRTEHGAPVVVDESAPDTLDFAPEIAAAVRRLRGVA